MNLGLYFLKMGPTFVDSVKVQMGRYQKIFCRSDLGSKISHVLVVQLETFPCKFTTLRQCIVKQAYLIKIISVVPAIIYDDSNKSWVLGMPALPALLPQKSLPPGHHGLSSFWGRLLSFVVQSQVFRRFHCIQFDIKWLDFCPEKKSETRVIHYRQKLDTICFIRQIVVCISIKLTVMVITVNFEPIL